MKLVFLDFDGVLNTSEYRAPIEDLAFGEELQPAVELNDEMVSLLNEIVEKADANIVISSSWAWSRSDAVLASLLHVRGLRDPGRVIGSLALAAIRTASPGKKGRANWDYHFFHPNAPNKAEKWTRLRCILYYLDRVKPEAFVILEDTHPMGPLSDHTVRTHPCNGLQPEHVEKALRILKCQK